MKILKKISAVIVAASSLITCFVPFLSIAEVKAVNTLSEETVDFYDYWKEKYLAQDHYVTNETQYYVFYGDETFAEAGYSVPVTVSEAHGYGMLIAASMAEYDSEAKDIFDGMYRYYRSHLSEIGPNLMAWQQSDNGTAKANGATPSKYKFMVGNSERIFGSVLSFNRNESDTDSVFTALSVIANKFLIPFGIDPFGNYICYSLEKNLIVFWDHETGNTTSTDASITDFVKSLY